MRSEGNQKLIQSDESFLRREEDRGNRKRKLAGDNQEDIARRGVEPEAIMNEVEAIMNEDNGLGADMGADNRREDDGSSGHNRPVCFLTLAMWSKWKRR